MENLTGVRVRGGSTEKSVQSRRGWSQATAVCPGPGSSTVRHAGMPSLNTIQKGKQRIRAVFYRKRSTIDHLEIVHPKRHDRR